MTPHFLMTQEFIQARKLEMTMPWYTASE